MKKLIFITFILLSAFLYSNGQDNIGSPYSIYGMGLLPENNGPYTAMGGVAAAMRDNSNINFSIQPLILGWIVIVSIYNWLSTVNIPGCPTTGKAAVTE